MKHEDFQPMAYSDYSKGYNDATKKVLQKIKEIIDESKDYQGEEYVVYCCYKIAEKMGWNLKEFLDTTPSRSKEPDKPKSGFGTRGKK